MNKEKIRVALVVLFVWLVALSLIYFFYLKVKLLLKF